MKPSVFPAVDTAMAASLSASACLALPSPSSPALNASLLSLSRVVDALQGVPISCERAKQIVQGRPPRPYPVFLTSHLR